MTRARRLARARLDRHGRGLAIADHELVVELDLIERVYALREGVSIAVNRRVVARDASHALIDGMLRTWSEDDPLSGKLRRLLLQHPC